MFVNTEKYLDLLRNAQEVGMNVQYEMDVAECRLRKEREAKKKALARRLDFLMEVYRELERHGAMTTTEMQFIFYDKGEKYSMPKISAALNGLIRLYYGRNNEEMKKRYPDEYKYRVAREQHCGRTYFSISMEEA